MNPFATNVLLNGSELVPSVVILKGSLAILLTLFALVVFRRRSADVQARVIGAGLAVMLFVAVLSLFTQGWWYHLETERSLLRLPLSQIFGGSSFLGSISSAQIGDVVLAIWALGAFTLLLTFIVAMMRATKAASESEPVEDERITQLYARACATLGLRARPRLVWASNLGSPSVVGLHRPTVLLPQEARGWSNETLWAVLLHEVGHIARSDYAWLVCAEAVRICYWMNPLVYLLLARLRRAQDHACDDIALRQGMSPRGYARELVVVAQSIVGGGPRFAPSMARRRSEIVSRIATIMAPGVSRTEAGRSTVLALGSSATLIAVSLGSLYPWTCQ